MKKYLLLFVLFGEFLMSACFNEDEIHAELGTYKRDYDTTSTDPVWKYVSQYYYKFAKMIIVDPDSSDYLFNFQYKHDVYMVKPSQEPEHLLKVLTFMKEMFLDGYSDDVKKNLFPYAILFADTIKNTYKNEYVDIYTTTYYIAFSVDDKKLNMSEEEKVKLSMQWNNKFLSYCTEKIGWTVPEEFYLYSDAEYGKKENWLLVFCPYEEGKADEPGDINLVWEKGYPIGKWDWNYDLNGEKVWGYSLSSSREGYLNKFFEFLFTTPQETIDKAIADHEKLRKAHDILDQALKDDFGINYRTMVYKAKK